MPSIPKEFRKNSNAWGGLDIGSSQLYSSQVVDGHVTELGGYSLRKQLQDLPIVNSENGYRCEVGHWYSDVNLLLIKAFLPILVVSICNSLISSVITEATEGLKHNFRYIIHTVPPFNRDKDMETKLKKCYSSAVNIAKEKELRNVVTPLLG